jgi:hypothetical protein
MPKFLEKIINYFYVLQIPDKYISNYAQIFLKNYNLFTNCGWEGVTPTRGMPAEGATAGLGTVAEQPVVV